MAPNNTRRRRFTIKETAAETEERFARIAKNKWGDQVVRERAEAKGEDGIGESKSGRFLPAAYSTPNNGKKRKSKGPSSAEIAVKAKKRYMAKKLAEEKGEIFVEEEEQFSWGTPQDLATRDNILQYLVDTGKEYLEDKEGWIVYHPDLRKNDCHKDDLDLVDEPQLKEGQIIMEQTQLDAIMSELADLKSKVDGNPKTKVKKHNGQVTRMINSGKVTAVEVDELAIKLGRTVTKADIDAFLEQPLGLDLYLAEVRPNGVQA